MTFPNALEGVKKIYKAEILELISGIVAVVAAIIAAVGVASEGVGGVVGGGLLFIAVAVLAIIAFIMGIVGVKKAMPDEENFKNAFYVLIVGIVASVVLGVGKGGGVLSNAGETLSSICSFLAQYYIITAIIALAKRLGDSEMEAKGLSTRKLIMIVWIIKIVLEVIEIFVDRSAALAVIGGIIGIVAAVIAIIGYVMYLKLLSKARVMLER